MLEKLRPTWKLVREAAREWRKDHAALLAAAVAFYATFAIGPLLVLIISMASFFLDDAGVRRNIHGSSTAMLGPRAANEVDRLVTQMVTSSARGNLTIVSTILLFVSASGVFRHLKLALNLIFDVPRVTGRGWIRFVRNRGIALVTVVCILICFVAAAAVSAALTLARRIVPDLVTGDFMVWRIVDFLVITFALVVLFTLVLKYVPDIRVKWRHLLVGAVPGALVVSIGRLLLAAYLGKTNLTDFYGAAASVFVILTAIYTSTLVLFASAELVEVHVRSDDEFTSERAEQQARAHYHPHKTGDEGGRHRLREGH